MDFSIKVLNVINIIIGIIVALASFIIMLIFGIFSCIPDGRYFKQRNLDFCISSLVLTCTFVLPLCVFAIIYGISFLIEGFFYIIMVLIVNLYLLISDYIKDKINNKTKNQDIPTIVRV